MYFFILLNLALGYLVGTESKGVSYFIADGLIYIGLFCIAGALILAWFGKVSVQLWYDLFACGTLLVWLPYWYPDFRDGSPVFFYFPLYFALITALFSLIFIKKRGQIDEQTLQFLHWISTSGRFNPAIMMAFVLLGLYVKDHFLLYPVAMTLFIMRYALASSLQE